MLLHRSLPLVAAVAIVSSLSHQRVAPQGPLTPPGAPTPSMKSLDQIDAHIDVAAGEKRIPIAGGTGPFVISSPGSYFLTGDLTGSSGAHVIEIITDRVTLDLNGYSLIGVSGSRAGVAVTGVHSAIKIRGGTIVGVADAIDTSTGPIHN